MMKVWLAGVLAMFATGVTIAQTVDTQTRPQAGKYESDLTLLSINIPGVPESMMGMMKKTISQKTTFCLSEAEVEEGYQSAMRKSQKGDCSFDRFNASGGTIDAVMTCDSEMGPMTMTINGSGTPTASDVTMQVSGSMEGAPMSMKMRVVQKRLGDC
jgi:hypothetical protein